jgi:hypothetical protein
MNIIGIIIIENTNNGITNLKRLAYNKSIPTFTYRYLITIEINFTWIFVTIITVNNHNLLLVHISEYISHVKEFPEEKQKKKKQKKIS